MQFLLALVAAFLGAGAVFLTSFTRKIKAILFPILLVLFFCIAFWNTYVAMPSLAYPLYGAFGGLILAFWAGVTMLAVTTKKKLPYAAWLPILGFAAIVITAISGWEVFNSSRYAGLIGKVQDKTQKHWAQEIPPLDPTHIRLVPRELALSLARTALSQDGNTLGSQYPLSEEYCTLQKINSDYWYLIPLDFKGYTVWTNSDGVPGYVKVSAVDPYAKPMLVTGKKFKYTPEAFFGDNLQRRLYQKYYKKVLLDYSFEEDDNGHAYWVITACSPTIAYSGLVVDGIIIFNPETGEDRFVKQKDIENDSTLRWVDRVMPAEIVAEYINYWGNLKDGWWNSFWSHINLLKAETPTMNYADNGRCIFVTPITSSSNADQAMTGLMYTDSRSGKFTYYTTSGGATEEAIIQAVNSAVSYKNWHGSEQIIYESVYGKMTGLVPILGQNGNYQGLALVENENKRVAIGATPQEALVEYQKLLMNSGGQISVESVRNTLEFTGPIKRLGWEISNSGKQYYISVEGLKTSFMISSNLQSELALTREGDIVYIKYINSQQAAVPVMAFKNLTLGLQAAARVDTAAKK
ncbi:MAG: energy-coupling factor transporter transmembrane protein EcfT [Ignavibacteria bacterium]|nr:energy-coupling factor transporter transmembrane protein EcfT [Ignavibacteria bacterium]